MSSPIIAWLINAVPNKVQDLINNQKIRLESFVFFCRRTTLASLTLENVILVTRQRKCSMLISWHTRTNLNKRTAPRLLPHYCLPMMKIWAISNFQLWPPILRFLLTAALKTHFVTGNCTYGIIAMYLMFSHVFFGTSLHNGEILSSESDRVGWGYREGRGRGRGDDPPSIINDENWNAKNNAHRPTSIRQKKKRHSNATVLPIINCRLEREAPALACIPVMLSLWWLSLLWSELHVNELGVNIFPSVSFFFCLWLLVVKYGMIFVFCWHVRYSFGVCKNQGMGVGERRQCWRTETSHPN